jgi:PAS domain S-box-containing protein
VTARQAEVVTLLARGYRTREIAETLAISDRAVAAHLTRLQRRFGVANRAALIDAVLTTATIPSFALPSDRDLARYADAPFLVAVTIGRDHVFAFVNDMWERVMGLRGRDVIGRPVRDVFPDRSATTYAARQRAFREGRPTTGNSWHFRWTQRDGSQREADLRYIYQPLRDPLGQVAGLMLIAITD